jgi:hypothetical protein
MENSRTSFCNAKAKRWRNAPLCAAVHRRVYFFRKNICMQNLPMGCRHRSHDEFAVREQTICHRGKEIRALAMTGNQRFELMPELPTMEQAGLKGFEVNNWYALFAPAGTPKEIVVRFNTEVVKIRAFCVQTVS